MLAPLALLAAFISAFVSLRRPRSRRARRIPPAHAAIVSPRRSTVIARDGGVRSVQTAKLTLAPDDLERLWRAPNLENLGRTYWRFLTRVTLGLIRVVYDADTRSVVLLRRPLTLLRFERPDYVVEPEHGNVTWRIRDGLLVTRPGRGSGFLSLDVRRLPDTESEQPGKVAVEVAVEVANFYPSIAAGFSVPVYEMTQSAIHVLVTHAFLRSLADLDLARSEVGVLADQP